MGYTEQNASDLFLRSCWGPHRACELTYADYVGDLGLSQETLFSEYLSR